MPTTWLPHNYVGRCYANVADGIAIVSDVKPPVIKSSWQVLSHMWQMEWSQLHKGKLFFILEC